jgi:hypothetical protein
LFFLEAYMAVFSISHLRAPLAVAAGATLTLTALPVAAQTQLRESLVTATRSAAAEDALALTATAVGRGTLDRNLPADEPKNRSYPNPSA